MRRDIRHQPRGSNRQTKPTEVKVLLNYVYSRTNKSKQIIQNFHNDCQHFDHSDDQYENLIIMMIMVTTRIRRGVVWICITDRTNGHSAPALSMDGHQYHCLHRHHDDEEGEQDEKDDTDDMNMALMIMMIIDMMVLMITLQDISTPPHSAGAIFFSDLIMITIHNISIFKNQN